MSHHRFVALALGAALALAGEARALTSFSLSLSGPDWDRTVFSFTNTSTAGEAVTGLSVLIGDTAYNFDFIQGVHPSEAATGATLVSPNRANNDFWVIGGESDTLAWSFTDFQAGETFSFAADIDHDFAIFGNVTDARSVLFNNDDFFGPDPNARVSVAFSDGSVASLTLPDAPLAGSYSYGSVPGAGGPASVPEPPVRLLLGVGLVGLVWLGQPRRPVGP